MFPLKLPEYTPKIRQSGREEIFCLVRKSYVALTPEEWVRQNFLNLLIEHLGYPKGMIRLEHGLQYFKNLKRSDIVVLDTQGNVFLLVECKSYEIALNEKVLKQLATYNKVLDASYVAITNGLKHYIWKRFRNTLEQVGQFPTYSRSD